MVGTSPYPPLYSLVSPGNPWDNFPSQAAARASPAGVTLEHPLPKRER
jgi:hypothetical protein